MFYLKIYLFLIFKRYIENMVRVLKPGGTIVVATWCQRHATEENPFSKKERRDL